MMTQCHTVMIRPSLFSLSCLLSSNPVLRMSSPMLRTVIDVVGLSVDVEAVYVQSALQERLHDALYMPYNPHPDYIVRLLTGFERLRREDVRYRRRRQC
ncbi:uncharacterized protein EV420DRAFT_255273 [Desarmillaria tabescens]|uniref:Uncharacterized protein n=1 Tax=Armillaria tabescens TaxID=1929756 RepID=A0AA39KFL0_ARMTA|nr:uncharacterized protein EV420DRAFT_255273 [Desarmillaria tabescens]KAK0460195.1 hypothetical protein EV420DRAFT_255273 [Desarmillaria tabescens]